MLYLASPYSHSDPAVRQARFEAACRAAAALMLRGHRVFSPIAHSHPIATLGNLHVTDHDFWMRQDAGFLHAARAVVVLALEGWTSSAGIQHELESARRRNLPIGMMTSPEHAVTGAAGGLFDLEALRT